MNGLLAIYKKRDTALQDMKALMDEGLGVMSHRGSTVVAFALQNKHLQNTDDEDVRLGIGFGSQQKKMSHFAHHNDDMLMFEGCLLNKKDLCADIQGSVSSDAAIVLRIIKEKGMAGLKLLHGYWSLIYLDAENKTLYGARDHFGNRPMYFCNTGNQFALASESRPLYTLFEDARSINRNMVVEFLLWGHIGQADQYFFNDIHSVEPAHAVKYEMETNQITVEKYYTLPYNTSKTAYHEPSEKHYLSRLKSLMTENVRKHLQLSGGPLAVGLSGGMDSSALLCLARKTDPDRTLAAYTTIDEYDGGEAKWAEKVVRHTGVEWIKVVCTPAFILEKSESINRVHSAPVYNASTIAQYKMMEEVSKQGQTVFIDGQGGDELFGGYPAYIPLFLQSLLKNREWKTWWNEWSQVEHSGMTKKGTMTMLFKLWAKAQYYTPQKIAQKKRKDIVESLIPQAIDSYFKQEPPIRPIKKETLNDSLYESYTLFLGNILRWGEHSAASQGISCVMPFADNPELTEYVFSIPSAFKIHNGWSKYLQRKAMIGIVPDEICLRRDKLGFYIPEQKWLEEIKDAMFDVIQKSDDPEDCICKRHILENGKRLFKSENPLYKQFIFRCFSYLQWRNAL